jgi:chromosomal replication initiator protein
MIEERMSGRAIWQAVLGEMEVTISRASFNTWFQNSQPLTFENNTLTVGVPNIFTKKQMEDKYRDRIEQVLVKHGYEIENIVYKIYAPIKSTPGHSSLVLDSLSMPTPTHSADTPATTLATGSTSLALNQKYTFDTFIVGSSNELAHAACQAVVKASGTKYNPLFIYGGSGLGKTHLIQAVGNGILAERPGSVVVYVTCETFVKDFLDFIRYKKKGSFGDHYRAADVLIVDDIQFIAGKERTEEAFFHTFNTLHQANKQIILSSDQPPRSIPTLEDRLRSRFEWGMAVDIQPPDFEVRCAILQTKAALHGLTLPQDTTEYLATTIQTNIRELEGSLNQLVAFCELKNSPPTIDIAVALLGNKRSQLKRLTAKQIIERTSRYFQIDLAELTGPKRDKDIVLPRQIAMYLLRSELHLSFPRIAAELGRKDHTTAMHSVEKIEYTISFDHEVRQHINEIKDRLHA